MTEIKRLLTINSDNGIPEDASFFAQEGSNTRISHTLTKSDIFNAVADNLNVPYKLVETRYYDNVGNKHNSGVEILRDLKAMNRLNLEVACGPYEGNKPQLTTSELVDSIWNAKEFADEISDAVNVVSMETDNDTMFMHLKRALYFINNRDSGKAVFEIIKVMEMVDEDR